MPGSGLTFNVFGRDVSASRTIRGVEDQASRSSDGIGSKMKSMAGGIAGALGAVGAIDFLKGSMDEARESQKVGAQTEAVLKSTGGAAGVTAGQIGDLAGAISKKTGIDDEAIQSGENMLLTFTDVRNEVGKGNDVFSQATQTLTDMSVATGIDMSHSAIQLGKALNDPIAGVGALSRVGVTFTNQQKDQIKALVDSGNKMAAQKIILHELNKEFGGSAAAQATASDKMSVAWGNVKEQVGTALIPVVDQLLNIMTNDVLPMLSSATTFLTNNWHWLKYVAGAVAGMWVAWKGYSIATEALTKLRSGITAVQSGFSTFRSAGGMGALAVTGIAVAGYAAGRAINSFVERGNAMAHTLDSLGKMSDDWRASLSSTNGELNRSTRLLVATQLQQNGLAEKAAKSGISLGQLTDAVVGTDDQTNKLIETWRKSGKPSGETIVALGIMHGKYQQTAQAVKAASAAADQHNNATKKNATSIKGQAGALATNTSAQKKDTSAALDATAKLKLQKDAADKLKTSLDLLSGKGIAAAQAELQFRDGMAQATQQVKDNGRSLSANTSAGRQNREWLLTQLSSLHDVASAQLDAGQKTSTVTQKLYSNEAALRQAAIGAGMNATQVNNLVRQYGQLPARKSTAVSAPGATTATGQVNGLHTAVGSLPGGRSVNIAAPGAAQASADVQTLRNQLRLLPGNVSVSVNAVGQIGVKGGGRYAQGIGHAPGGVATVGEHGAERVYLPAGSTVVPHSTAMSQDGGGGGVAVLQVDVRVTGGLASDSDVQRGVAAALEGFVQSGGAVRIARGIRQ